MKKNMIKTCLMLATLFGSTLIYADKQVYQEAPKAYNTLTIQDAVVRDYKSFYTEDRAFSMGVAFGLGAIVANSSADQSIRDWYQNNQRSSNTDKFSKVFKNFGEGKYMLPLALLAGSVNYFKPSSDIGVWGVYATRSYIVGLPALVIVQRLTGASRPNERSYNSKWNSFKDANGVSGHSFVGAVPFLTLANMYEDNPYIKYSAYAASFLTAWSRINDDAHYFSQAALGWFLAYESVNSVFDGDRKNSKFSVSPILGKDRYGISVQMKW